MSSILRKATWPAALIVSMFVLIGAIGTATAPTAHADVDDICAIIGPIPLGEVEVENTAGDYFLDLMLEGETYGFIVVVEDVDAVALVDVSVDDEDGDVDLSSYVSGEGADTYTDGLSTDVFNNLPVYDAATLAAGAGAIEWADEFDFDLASLDGSDCGALAGDPPAPVADGYVLFDATCDRVGTVEITAAEDTETVPDNSFTVELDCVGPADTVEISATRLSLESYPAPGNYAHSLITAVYEDEDGNPAYPGDQVDWTVSGSDCVIEAVDPDDWPVDMSELDEFDGRFFVGHGGHGGLDSTDSGLTFMVDPGAPGFSLSAVQTIAQAILHCEGADPGVASVEAEVERPGPDLVASIDITVVGPPAFITMTAAPEELTCGEKATILVTVTDALNQNVSDHTLVELITNFGGVIGGTGSSLTTFQPVNPLSSSNAETFGGVATAYLLTSTTHVGDYEVVAAAGGSYLGGQFSTPVVTSQVTVSCSEGAAPDVTAPDTGTGTISPPNTGDAGLAAGTASTTLLVIAGAVAFVLAGFAKLGFARR